MNWDAYFLNLAKMVSHKSKDPSTHVGAVIVDGQRRVVSVGYNGFPRGIPDDLELLTDRETKLRLTLHAEANALLFAQRDLAGCSCYVWPCPPCAQCAAMLTQSGIVRVVSPIPSDAFAERWQKDLELATWIYAQRGITHDCLDDWQPTVEQPT